MSTVKKVTSLDQSKGVKHGYAYYLRDVLFPSLDFLPVLKLRQHLTFKSRIGHTLVGYLLYVLLLVVPQAGFYNVSDKRKFTLIFTDQRSVASLCRNTLTVAPLLTEVVFRVLLPKEVSLNNISDQKKERCKRGLKILFFISAIYISQTYNLFWVGLPGMQVVALGNLDIPIQRVLLSLVFYLQGTLMAVFSIWLDDYFTACSLGSGSKIAYYQLSELVIKICYDDPIINYKLSHLIGGTLFVLVVKSACDIFFNFEYTLEHEQIKGYSKTQMIKPSLIILNATFIYNTVKKGLTNFYQIIVEPVYNYLIIPYLQKALTFITTKLNYKNIDVSFLLLPNGVLQNPLTTVTRVNWTVLPFMPSYNNYTALNFIYYMIIEIGLLVPFTIYNVQALTPELRPSELANRLKSNSLYIKGVQNTENSITKYLKKELKRLIYISIIMYMLTETIFVFVPVYYLTLKAGDVSYIYNLVLSISQSFKSISKVERDSLNYVLRTAIASLE